MDEINFNIDPKTISTLKYDDYTKEIIKFISYHSLKSEKEYQVVIMAAGKGSRMKNNYPKPLHKIKYPYAEIPILENLIITLIKSNIRISKINLVINKNNLNDFNIFNKTKYPYLNTITLEEEDIKGTGFCLNAIKNKICGDQDILLLWGDIGIIPASIINISCIINENSKSDLVFPTRIKKDPYVAFIRNNKGIFETINHSNEDSKYHGIAEQDCCFFIISQETMKIYDSFIKKEINNRKEEIDFIHFISFLTSNRLKVIGLPIGHDKLVSGVNTQEKAKSIQNELEKYSKESYEIIFQTP